MKSRSTTISFGMFTLYLLLHFGISEAAQQTLKAGWLVRSSTDVAGTGEQISITGFDCSGWYSTTVPSTVLSVLAKNKVYRDLYYGRNLETVSPEPFLTSWWYRTEFDMPAGRAENVRLIFDGINYSANIFVNGTRVADADQVYGAFRRFDVDVSRLARKKGNVLAVQVFPPKPGDFTIGFVDWNPSPPDRNMGLFREVKVRTSGPVSIEQPYVQTKLDLQAFQEATLTVTGSVVNHTDLPVSGKILGEIEGDVFEEAYSLKAKETKEVRFKRTVKNPRVWWPNNLGKPELYTLKLDAHDPRGNSDSQTVTFGVREVADYMNEQGHRGYMINGRKVLIRGGGWSDDLLLDENEANLDAQMRYTKHMNLNTIRLEGFWGSSEKLYELADRYGLLVMVGFSCQWEWDHYLGKKSDDFGGIKTEEDMQLVVQYLHDQVLWLRNHPSIFVWVIASDKLPRPELEKRYRSELAGSDPARPILASCQWLNSDVSGPTGVKMNGPYEYVTPNYWYEDTENGGAFGFNTETGPGAQPPPYESIHRMFAMEHDWPVDDTWNYHCGRNEFNNMKHYMNAFNKRYGEVEDVYEFAKKAQASNYEAIRPMFEAFGTRKPVATGIVQWMLNATWPKMFWQLYDYYLLPGGAFYGARKANQPLNVVYDYGSKSIHLVNDTFEDYPALDVAVKVLSVESKELYAKVVKTQIGQNESKSVLDLPSMENAAPVYFVSLKLMSDGRILADNFYWLSTKADVLDSEKTEWYYTPNKEFGDFTALNKLAPAEIQTEHKFETDGVTVTLKNPGSQIAFFIELKVVGDKTGRSILPVFWDDNYVSLLPGETRQLTARYSAVDLHGEKPLLQVSKWN